MPLKLLMAKGFGFVQQALVKPQRPGRMATNLPRSRSLHRDSSI
jgi:hypothetical protein